jgi:hypothetical protein
MSPYNPSSTQVCATLTLARLTLPDLRWAPVGTSQISVSDLRFLRSGWLNWRATKTLWLYRWLKEPWQVIRLLLKWIALFPGMWIEQCKKWTGTPSWQFFSRKQRWTVWWSGGMVQTKDMMAKMFIEEGNGGSHFKQALHRVWVQMSGLSGDLREYLATPLWRRSPAVVRNWHQLQFLNHHRWGTADNSGLSAVVLELLLRTAANNRYQ